MKEKNETIYDAGYEDGYRAAVAGRYSAAPRNETAFILGVIAGLFGIWGLSYVLNDKVGTGCLWMFIVGPGIAALLVGLTLMTAGLGAILALPLWLYIVYAQAKSGASNV